jgi:CheY-like chemotaxis protein
VTVATLIRDILQPDGFQVEFLLDVASGIEKLLASSYDVVLCDLRMAGTDGRAIYEMLQQAGSPLLSRFAFVTGDTMSQSSLAFLKQSGVPYLAKPFLVEDLRQFVASLLITENPRSILPSRAK